MTDTETSRGCPETLPENAGTGGRQLSAPALRALDEAEARRRTYLASEACFPTELGGRDGKEPVRYGDWEVKGLAADF